MNELEKVRAEVLGLFPAVEAELDKEVAKTRGRLLEGSRERLELNRYHVVVCGEFRRGKSSMLNALVERPGLFPVDVAVTTSAVTTLRWGPREEGVVYFVEDPLKPETTRAPEEIPLSAAVEYVTEQGNKDNHKNVARIEMAAPIPNLKSGLVLVDTPGVGSLNVEHTAATRAFLPNADAILFVAAATEPLGLVELEFLRHALEQCPIVVTAVTMIDKLVDPSPTIAEARVRIAEVTGAPAGELVLVGVSAQRKRRALREDDTELLADSGFPELERELWGGLAVTCGRARLGQALDALEEALTETAAPVANALVALRDDEELRKVDAEIRAAQEQARELSSQSSRWRGRLKEELEVAVRPIRSRLLADFDRVGEDFNRAVETERALSDPGSLVREVSDGLLDAVNLANRSMMEEAERLAARFSQETSTPITVGAVGSGYSPDLRQVDSPQTGETRKGWSRFRSVWNTGMAGAGVGGLIGLAVGLAVPVVGPFVGPLVGSVLGKIVGWFGGHRDSRRQEAEQAERAHRARLRGEVGGMLGNSRRQAELDFTHQVTDCGRALVRALEDQIDAQSQSQKETIRRLTEVKKQTGQQRAAQAAELTALAGRYTALRDRITALRARVEALSR